MARHINDQTKAFFEHSSFPRPSLAQCLHQDELAPTSHHPSSLPQNMPYVDLYPPSGHIKVSYYISTPKSHSAEEILFGIPTILFLHSSGMASQIFECMSSAFRLASRVALKRLLAQWADPGLRQFNLVAFDMRAHGLTTGSLKSGPINIVEDIHYFMVRLSNSPA